MKSNFSQYISRISDERSEYPGKPWLSWLLQIICVVVFFLINSMRNSMDIQILYKWGVLSPETIWNGAFWGLITSVFVHVQAWHLAGNLLWLYIFSGTLELEIGRLKWLMFFIVSAFISSGIELAITGDAGIGASGIVYAMFGFMWVTRDRYAKFKSIVTNDVILLFMIWLFAAIALTWVGAIQIGNAAHVSGLLFGAGIGMCQVRQKQKPYFITALSLMAFVSVLSLFWCPWSANWVSTRAYDQQTAGHYAEAIALYNRSIEMGQAPVWVLQNLAISYWNSGNKPEYETTIDKLRKLDSKAAEEIEQKTMASYTAKKH